MKQLAIDDHVHSQLVELGQARKASHSLNYTLKGIIAELIAKAHKKECK